MECTSYSEWESHLKPCDLILFSNDGPVGKCILWFEKNHLKKKTKWVHAGFVCPQLLMDFENKNTSQTYIVESLISGFDGVPNVVTNTWHNGLQIRNLRELVANTISTGGSVGAFRVINNPCKYTILEERALDKEQEERYVAELSATREIANKYWKMYNKAEYDFCNCGRAVSIWTPFELFGGRANKRLFCSEAVALFYQDLGLISKNVIAEKISPEELGTWSGELSRHHCPISLEPYIISSFSML